MTVTVKEVLESQIELLWERSTEADAFAIPAITEQMIAIVKFLAEVEGWTRLNANADLVGKAQDRHSEKANLQLDGITLGEINLPLLSQKRQKEKNAI